MRILHVWDQAGVAALMAKYQRKLGHEAVVLKRKGFDALGLTGFYGAVFIQRRRKFYSSTVSSVAHHFLPIRFRVFVKTVLRKIMEKHETLTFFIKVMRYAKTFDIVHIHSKYKCAFFLPFRKKIVEFHGDDMRRSPRKTSGSFFGELDHVIKRVFLHVFGRTKTFCVSTVDMLKEVPHSRWIPNPVDLNHFYPRNSSSAHNPSKEALYTHNWYETGRHAQEWAKQNKMGLVVLDRARNQWIPYEDMPELFSHFKYLIDRKEIQSLSKTALEALALGLKVVRWDGKIVQGLPDCHKPEKVADLTLKIYRGVIG